MIILLVATPIVAHLSFADKIYPIRPGATLALGCDLVNDKDFATSTEVFKLPCQCYRRKDEIRRIALYNMSKQVESSTPLVYS